MQNGSRDVTIPLSEEEAHVERRLTERAAGNIQIETVRTPVSIAMELSSERIEVTRSLIDQFVEAMPPVRQEGDTTIYPVVEEVLVTRLLLREEVRVTRRRHREHTTREAVLRRQVATIVAPPSSADDAALDPPDPHNPNPDTEKTHA